MRFVTGRATDMEKGWLRERNHPFLPSRDAMWGEPCSRKGKACEPVGASSPSWGEDWGAGKVKSLRLAGLSLKFVSGQKPPKAPPGPKRKRQREGRRPLLR